MGWRVAALCGVGPRMNSEIDVAADHLEELVIEWGPEGDEERGRNDVAVSDLMARGREEFGLGPAHPADDEDEGWRYTQGDRNARRPPELLTRDRHALFVEKPFTGASLLGAVARLLRAARATLV